MKTINGRMRPLANLAMSLALLSIPVQAMAQDNRGDRGGWRGAEGSGGERRGGGAPMQGQPQRQPQSQPQGQPGGFGGHGGGQPSWGGGNAAPAARPAPPAPPAPAAPGGWNGGNRGPDRGGWGGGPGNVQPQRNDGPRGDMQRGEMQRRDGPRGNENWRGGGNESWRGTPGWPQGGVNRGPQGWDRGPQGAYNRGPNNGPGWNGNRGPGNPGMNAPRGDYRRWTQDWRRDNRYDWQRYRTSNRMAFHIGRYNPPYRGYAYRRLSVGLFLQPLFYSQGYVIYDPYNYRLPAVYGPYQWVRYYDDALLVDTYTGEVVDVLYDFFW